MDAIGQGGCKWGKPWEYEQKGACEWRVGQTESWLKVEGRDDQVLEGGLSTRGEKVSGKEA